MATILIVLAPGAEEIELITVADVLVRAGQQVTIAGTVAATVVAGSRGLPLGAHRTLDAARDSTWDVVYLPGGMGSATICRDDARIQDLAQRQLAGSGTLACICAATIALVPRRLAADRQVTSYPGVRPQVEPHVRRWLDQAVVEDGNLITSQGPGTAMALALALARLTAGESTAARVAKDLLVEPRPCLEPS